VAAARVPANIVRIPEKIRRLLVRILKTASNIRINATIGKK
jgi:hypothetical protein